VADARHLEGFVPWPGAPAVSSAEAAEAAARARAGAGRAAASSTRPPQPGGVYRSHAAWEARFTRAAVEGGAGLVHDGASGPSGDPLGACRIFLPAQAPFVPLSRQFAPWTGAPGHRVDGVVGAGSLGDPRKTDPRNSDPQAAVSVDAVSVDAVSVDAVSVDAVSVDPEGVVRVRRAVSLLQTLSYHFYHWMAECLPRLLLVEEAGVLAEADSAAADPVFFIVPGRRGSRGFVQESLSLLGHGGRRVIWHEEGIKVVVDELWTADWRPFAGPGAAGGRLGQAFHAPRLGLARLQARWAPVRATAPRVHGAARARVVVLSRNEAGWKTRTASNEPQLLQALRTAFPSAEVTALRPAEVAMADARRALAEATVVVGVHGGAMANAVFCAPGAALVEVALAEPMYRHYMHLAAALGLRYWIAGPPLAPGHFDRAGLSLPVDAIVDATALAAGLRRAGRSDL
jgi:hypothetical protein